MTFFISHVHNDLRGTRLTKRGSTRRASEVPIGLHKEYSRMQKIALPAPANLNTPLADALKKRSSYRGGTDTSVITLEDFGTLFGLALGRRNPSSHRNYPSGGALYPIETYLVTALQNGTSALFHYNPTLHALEKLWDLPPNVVVKDLVKRPDDLLFSSVLIFTSVWKRSSAKYGDFTYTVAMLEAGHMSENVLLTATALGLKSRPMAGFDDDLIVSLLDLDPEEEQPVHTIVLC